MAESLVGKRALVTGAAQGIGLASTMALVREGAHVLATDTNRSKLAELPMHGGSLDTAALDVTDGEAIAALAAMDSDFDILVNVAGFVHQGSILDCEEMDWDFSFDLNVKSMYRMIRAFLPAMLEAGSGSIINIASVASSIRGLPSRCAYGASKAAVIGLTKAVAADTIKGGVRCNAVCPGTVESPSLEQRIASFEDPAAARKAFIARQPMGRLGTPEEVAAAVAYLASDAAAFTTGTTLIVDGGVAL